MRRLPEPKWTAREVFEVCIEGVADPEKKERWESAIDEMENLALDYEEKGRRGHLFLLEARATGPHEEAGVVGGLCKDEMLQLYETYLRGKSKPGRDVYDALIKSSDYKCPYCGGLGEPRNIDHYLPKHAFPQFSVFPKNLVPACRDCNMEGKGSGQASTEVDQIIHPYLDHERFFRDQWLTATVIHGNPCALKYSVCAPAHWNDVDEKRAIKHFNDFNIGRRYGVCAAEELSTIIYERRTILRDVSAAKFSEHLAVKAGQPLFPNHWKRVMYQTLSRDAWFCRQNW